MTTIDKGEDVWQAHEDVREGRMGGEMKRVPEWSAATTMDDPRLTDSGIRLPLVSIIVTNYNYARYILETLGSVCRQSYPLWECIVVDDVSTDGSMESVEGFLRQHPNQERFILVQRETNGGQMEAFRDGLARARGELCMTLDADDVLLPDFLETHVRAHLGRKSVAFTSSNQYQINAQGQVIAGDHPDHLAKGKLRYVPEAPLHKGYWIWATASSMVFRRETLNLLMPKPGVTFRICADYYIAQFANQLGNSLLIPTIHGCYRRHGENNFGSNPVVGAINSVGCLDQHPPHDEFRWAMINHILDNYPRFYRIYMEKGVVRIICRLARLKEVLRIIREHRSIFTRPAWWYAREYLNFHLPRWRNQRKPWKDRLVIVPEDFFYEGKGENPFP